MDNKITIKKSIINQIEEMKSIKVDKSKIISQSLVCEIINITQKTGKEIAVFINRKGDIIDIIIGESDSITFDSMSTRRNEEKLNGVRCIHTHPNGNSMLSDIDIAALIKYKFDMMVTAAKINDQDIDIHFATINVSENNIYESKIYGPVDIKNIESIDFQYIIESVEKIINQSILKTKEIKKDVETAILIGIEDTYSLDELSELLKTAGGNEIKRIVQKREKIESAFFLGKGKVKEIQLEIQKLNPDIIVFDEQLTGIQLRNLEQAFGVKVLDRTQLILDIFAKRARTREGKLQVELAQMKYMLPRLVGVGEQMSRTGGGIGTRGPGEKKLEIDKRRIRERVHELETEIKEIKKHRNIQRQNRIESGIFQACLVGYTNAGKSTLLNAISDSDVYAMDQLFATLDPTTRRVILGSGKEILITDTVGFINKLPHQLIEAFKSTLEEVLYADILIHVVDISNYEYEKQMEVVKDVLNELGASDKEIITVFNKSDKISDDISIEDKNLSDNYIKISALNKKGIDILLQQIEKFESKRTKKVTVLIPYDQGSVLSYIHSNSKILNQDFDEKGTVMNIEIAEDKINKISKFIVTPN